MFIYENLQFLQCTILDCNQTLLKSQCGREWEGSSLRDQHTREGEGRLYLDDIRTRREKSVERDREEGERVP